MQQHKKFRSPEQGYSRRAMKARTSRAIQLTLEDDLEMDVHDLGDDSIAQLMRGSQPPTISAPTPAPMPVPVAMAPTAPQGAVMESGRYVAAKSSVTHVVRGGTLSAERETAPKQGMIDRLLSMIRRNR